MVPRTCPAIRYGSSPATSIKTEGNQAVLHWKGNYGKDFDGGFEIRMDDAGDAEFRYEFNYNGPDMWVREIGLDFELPLAFDKLSWDRNAEYSYYPADHIGRPLGEAVAHPAVPQTVPAGDRPFGLDDHPLGSNDFRSTKRHIYTASLTEQGRAGRRSDFRRHAARPRDRGRRTKSTSRCSISTAACLGPITAATTMAPADWSRPAKSSKGRSD